MTTHEVKQKLAAILIADVKGYSRLMGEDEAWTVQTLIAYKKIIITHIQEHKGRLVQAVGDNLLAEFAGAVDAVQCSVEIQKELKIRNAQLPENRRMEFRIGVNLGNMIEEGDKVFGDGVNVTLKLESLSAAGGVCISGAAYDYVKNRLGLRYEYLGEQSVKNIEKPVRVYRVLIDAKGWVSKLSIWKGGAVRQWERLNPVVKVIIALVAVGNAAWQIYPLFFGSPLPIFSKGKFVSSSSDKVSKAEKPSPEQAASRDKMAFPLPDIPSIAVLPFANMSGDPKQEFLCDGITEEIITALSKVPELFVISRQSTFTYKGKPVKVKQVSEELGVRYVLEGSVQRSADRIRINAQLIDALTGNHLWADRYERDLKDIFALQDEITMKVLGGVRVKLTGDGLIGRTEKYFKGKHGLDCFLKILEASAYRQRMTIEDNNLARRLAEEAIAMCPENPMGYLSLGWAYNYYYWQNIATSPQEILEKGIELAQKAIAMDDSLADAHALLCIQYRFKKQYDKAIVEGERAVALNPGGYPPINAYALTLTRVGRAEEAIPLFQKGIRLNPFGPSPIYINFGRALRTTGRFEEAVSAYKKAIKLAPHFIDAHVGLAATYSMMGLEKEARAEAAEILRINPKFSVDSYAKGLDETDKYINALRKAGLN
jgi:TolB-like protein/class 3 adenylate cyclase